MGNLRGKRPERGSCGRAVLALEVWSPPNSAAWRGVLLEPVGPQIGAGDVDRVRKVLKTLSPVDVEFAAILDVALRKLEKQGAS